MEEYITYLTSGDAGEMLASDWNGQLLTNPDLKFSETRNYFDELLIQEIKKDKVCAKPEGEQFVRAWLTDTFFSKKQLYINTPVEQQRRIYRWWLDNKYFEFRKTWKPNSGKNDGLNYLFITLNFSPDTQVTKMLEETNRIVSLSVFSRCKLTYCFEYYTSDGTHPHVHILVELLKTGTIPMSSILEKIYQKKSLRDIMKDNIKFSWASDYKKRSQSRAVCLAYVTGNKCDDKNPKTELDKKWRQENNLEQMYIRENN